MKGLLYINIDLLGEVDFAVTDNSMGAIGGNLIPNNSYEIYRKKIQQLYEIKGIANIDDFDFKVYLNNIIIITEGGIGVSDAHEFDEIYVEVAGVDLTIFTHTQS